MPSSERCVGFPGEEMDESNGDSYGSNSTRCFFSNR